MDLNGQLLRVITDLIFKEGRHEVTFSRELLIAGIYFLEVKTNEEVVKKKIMIKYQPTLHPLYAFTRFEE
jgi:hypothetical protein